VPKNRRLKLNSVESFNLVVSVFAHLPSSGKRFGPEPARHANLAIGGAIV